MKVETRQERSVSLALFLSKLGVAMGIIMSQYMVPLARFYEASIEDRESVRRRGGGRESGEEGQSSRRLDLAKKS